MATIILPIIGNNNISLKPSITENIQLFNVILLQKVKHFQQLKGLKSKILGIFIIFGIFPIINEKIQIDANNINI